MENEQTAQGLMLVVTVAFAGLISLFVTLHFQRDYLTACFGPLASDVTPEILVVFQTHVKPAEVNNRSEEFFSFGIWKV